MFGKDKSMKSKNNSYLNKATDSINKAKDNDSWMKNAGMSAGFAAYDSILNTNIGRTLRTEGKETYGRMSSDIRSMKEETTGSISKSIKDIAKNTKDSLKTGEIYSKDRTKQAEEDSMASMGLDFGDMDFDDDFTNDFSDEHQYTDDDSNAHLSKFDEDIDITDNSPLEDPKEEKKATGETAAKNILNIRRTVNKKTVIDNSGISKSEADKVNQSVISSATSLIHVNTAGFNSLAGGIGGLTELTNKGSMDTLSHLSTIRDNLDQVARNNAKTSMSKNMSSSSFEDLLTGNFSLTNLTASLEGNLSMFKEMVLPMVTMGITNFAANPLNTVMTMLMTEALTRKSPVKGFFNKFDSKFTDLPLKGMQKVNDTDLNSKASSVLSGDNFLSKVIDSKAVNKVSKGKISTSALNSKLDSFNINDYISKKIFKIDTNNLDVSSKVSKSTPRSFDAEAHDAINVVIPGYLGKILEGLTGKSVYNDYKSGMWKDGSKAQSSITDRLNDYLSETSTGLTDQMSTLFSDQLTPSEIKSLVGEITKNSILKTEDVYGLSDNFDMDIVDKLEEHIAGNSDTFYKSVKTSQVNQSKYYKSEDFMSGSMKNMLNDDTKQSKVDIKSLVNTYDTSLTELNGTQSILDDIKRLLAIKKDTSKVYTVNNSLDPKVSKARVDSNIDQETFSGENLQNSTVMKDSSVESKTQSSVETVQKDNATNNSFDPKVSNARVDSTIDQETPFKTVNETNEESSVTDKIESAKDMYDNVKDTKLFGRLKNTKIGNKVGSYATSGSKVLSSLSGKASTLATNGLSKVTTLTAGKSAGKIGASILGKTGVKTASKVGSKLATKMGAKSALKLGLNAIPGIGTAASLLMSAPEIFKTLKNPIESLKSPLKTLGSFIGLSEHPADSEDEQKMLANGVGPDQGFKGDEMSGVSGVLGGLATTLFNISPLGLLSALGPNKAKSIMGSSLLQESVSSPSSFAKKLFSTTLLGGLLGLATVATGATVVTKGISGIGKLFSGLFDSIKNIGSGDTVYASSSNASTNSSGSSGSSSSGGGSTSGGTFTASSFGGQFTKTSDFGYRTSPGGIGSTNHKGIDYAAPEGTPIRSVSDGKVIHSAYDQYGGNVVKIQSGDIVYAYKHARKNLVSVGDQVTKGQVISEVGNTGISTGPHLHFEMIINGKHVNPETGLDADGKKLLTGTGSKSTATMDATPTKVDNNALKETKAIVNDSTSGNSSSSTTTANPSYTVLSEESKQAIYDRSLAKYTKAFGVGKASGTGLTGSKGSTSNGANASSGSSSNGSTAVSSGNSGSNNSNNSGSNGSTTNNNNNSTVNNNTNNSSTSNVTNNNVKNIINNIKNNMMNIVHNNTYNNKKNTINNFFGDEYISTTINGNSGYEYDYNQYLILRDLLEVVDVIGIDMMNIDETLSDTLEAIKGSSDTRDSILTNRKSMNDILKELNDKQLVI